METKNLDPNTQLKLHLLERFCNPLTGGNKELVDFCREAYKFIVEGDILIYKGTDDQGNHCIERMPINVDDKGNARFEGRIPEWAGIEPKDGVYLLYRDDDGKEWCELFDQTNDKTDAVGVAFKFGAVSLRLYDKDLTDCKMTTKKDAKGDEYYITSYAKAAHDFNGKRWTELLLERGLSFKDKLQEGWWIPSVGELYVMYMMKTYINDALEYIGQPPLKDTWYWSSTEYSATDAWYLNFGDGYFGGYYKTGELSVRPVSAFNPLSL